VHTDLPYLKGFPRERIWAYPGLNGWEATSQKKRFAIDSFELVDVLLAYRRNTSEEAFAKDFNVQFRNAHCIIYNDVVCFASEPNHWSAAFSTAKPKLRLQGLLFGGNFSIDDVTLNEPDKPPLEETEDFPTIALQSIEGASHGTLIQATMRFPNLQHYERAKIALGMVEKLKSDAFVGSEYRKSIIEVPPSSSMVSPSSPIFNQAYVQQTSNLAVVNSLSKLPGANMVERRKLAIEMKKQRGAWVPRELEHPTARKARELIEKREGRDILRTHSSNDSNQGPTSPRSTGMELQVSIPGSAPSRRQSLASSVSRKSSVRSTNSSDRRLGFGSSAKLERCAETPNRFSNGHSRDRFFSVSSNRSQSSRKASIKSPSNRNDQRFDDEVVEEKGIDFSIFKAPKQQGKSDPLPQAGGKRYIGLDWKASEYVKERNFIDNKLVNTKAKNR